MNKDKYKERFNIIRKLWKNIKDDHISEYSAQCAYYTILSFIPFVVLLLTLIQYTRLEPQTLFEAVSKIVPSSMNEIVLDIIQEVYSKSIGTISISIIFTVWAAGRGLFALTKGLQFVYNIDNESKESYLHLRMKSIIETIVFLLLIVAGLIILVFGNSLKDIIQEHFNGLKNYNVYSFILTKILLVFFTFIVFILLYKFIPMNKVKFRNQIWGAFFGAIALNLISFIFSKYLYIFKGFSITYGSLTTLMLIMMWTYSCFYTVFFGAELNKLINKKN